jgi:hypothetical protein
MKHIYTFLFLFLLSGVAVAQETVWYCTSELGGALQDEGETGNWELVRLQPQRFTLKVHSSEFVTLINSATPNWKDKYSCKGFPSWPILACTHIMKFFVFNTVTGYASHADIGGRVRDDPYTNWFQLDLITYKCEKF